MDADVGGVEPGGNVASERESSIPSHPAPLASSPSPPHSPAPYQLASERGDSLGPAPPYEGPQEQPQDVKDRIILRDESASFVGDFALSDFFVESPAVVASEDLFMLPESALGLQFGDPIGDFDNRPVAGMPWSSSPS